VARLALGVALRRHIIVWLGHALLGLTYLILLVGILLPVLAAGYPWDNIRFGSTLLTPMLLHLILALRTGPRPLPPESATPVAVIGRADG